MKKRSLFPTLLALAGSSALADKVVSIGYSGPLSGGAAFYGKDVQSGIDMAISELNRSGVTVKGEKVTFKLVALDDRYLPNETATNVKRLTSQGIDIVFVPQSLVSVMGQVGKPGEVSFRDGLTVSQCVAAAGGALPTAALGNLYILRGDKRLRVNLRRILAGTADDLVLQAGDRLYVPESAF